MALTNALTSEQMKQFLYGELPDDAAQAIEEQLFANNDLFYELTSFENELIDKYVRGQLEGAELIRFEQSLLRSDERREQVKNARALQRYITAQKSSAAPAAGWESSRSSIWARVVGFVSFTSPVVQYAMGILLALLGISLAWLLYDSHRVRQELAQARSEQGQRERELQTKIVETERQIESLQQAVKEQSGQNEALNATLKEREAELAQLKREMRRDLPNELIALAGRPTITGLDVRGDVDAKVVKYDAKYVTVRLLLTGEADYQTYEIREKDKSILGPAAIRKITDAKSGKTYLSVKLPARNMVFTVVGNDPERGKRGVELGKYRIQLQSSE